MDTPLCHYCRKPIDTRRDDYVPIEVESGRYDTPQFVAHRACRVAALQSEVNRLSDDGRQDR